MGARTPAMLHHSNGMNVPLLLPSHSHPALSTWNTTHPPTLLTHPPPHPPPTHLEAAVVPCRGLVPRPAAQPLGHQPVLQPKHLHQRSRQLLVTATGATTPTSTRPCAAPSSSSRWRGGGGGIAGGGGRCAGAEGGLAAAFPGAGVVGCQVWCSGRVRASERCGVAFSLSALVLQQQHMPLLLPLLIVPKRPSP